MFLPILVGLLGLLIGIQHGKYVIVKLITLAYIIVCRFRVSCRRGEYKSLHALLKQPKSQGYFLYSPCTVQCHIK